MNYVGVAPTFSSVGEDTQFVLNFTKLPFIFLNFYLTFFTLFVRVRNKTKVIYKL